MAKTSSRQPATKGDLAAVETGLNAPVADVRTELKADIRELDLKIERLYLSQVQADANLDRKMDKLMDKLDKFYNDFMSAFDKYIAMSEKHDQEWAACINALRSRRKSSQTTNPA